MKVELLTNPSFPISLAYLTDLTGTPQGYSSPSDAVLEGLSLISISKKEKESWSIGTPNFLENHLTKGEIYVS